VIFGCVGGCEGAGNASMHRRRECSGRALRGCARRLDRGAIERGAIIDAIDDRPEPRGRPRANEPRFEMVDERGKPEGLGPRDDEFELHVARIEDRGIGRDRGIGTRTRGDPRPPRLSVIGQEHRNDPRFVAG